MFLFVCLFLYWSDQLLIVKYVLIDLIPCIIRVPIIEEIVCLFYFHVFLLIFSKQIFFTFPYFISKVELIVCFGYFRKHLLLIVLQFVSHSDALLD